MLCYLPALLMPSSMESHAAAMLVFTNQPSMPALDALRELAGTATPAALKLPKPVLWVMSSTKIQTSVNLQLPHVETMPTSMELAASALLATI
jgi:hypothetical protein